MAVTSIWPIKGRVDKVINYARNPEKTTESGYNEQSALHAIDGVVEYAADEMKTESRAYVTCIRCTEETAVEQFIETKRFFQKTDGRLCYHGYQSFKADEVNAQTAHTIGVALAQELWGDRFEVVVATHCNTGHYHNHFVINSVSCVDGYKFYNSHEDYRRMREVSDRLCREARLSVIENPKGQGKHYAEWQAEQNGKPTIAGMVRADIDRAILASTTQKGFWKVMREMGYELYLYKRNGELREQPSVRPPGTDKNIRLSRLREGYSLEEITQRILQNVRKQNPFPEAEEKPVRKYRIHGDFKNAPKMTGLRALYFRYCYELHIIVKRPASVKRVPFSLREDVIKLDRYISEARFLGKEKISTIGQLTDYRTNAQEKIAALIQKRSDLRNQLKRTHRQGDEKTVAAVKAEIRAVSAELKGLRKEVSLCDGIEQRSGQIKTNLGLLKQEKENERKEKTTDEHIRRSGGSGRSYATKRR
jgi:hypothetical protein